MYTVEVYENDRGVSELWDILEELRIKSASNKDARIQYKQIVLYIQLLQDNGTRLSENVTKHLMDGDLGAASGEITGYSTSVGGVTGLCCCTSFGRNREKNAAA